MNLIAIGRVLPDTMLGNLPPMIYEITMATKELIDVPENT